MFPPFPAFVPQELLTAFHVGVSPESAVSDAALKGSCVQDQRFGNDPVTGKLI
jgi:hypothetical protein